MLKINIFSKIFLLMVLMSFVVGALILYVNIRERARSVEDDLVRENQLLAKVLALVIETDYLAEQWPFQTLKLTADSENIVFLWVVKPSGEVYFADDPEMFGKQIKFPFLGTEKAIVRDSVYPKEGEMIKLVIHPLKMELKGKPWSLCLGVSLALVDTTRKEIIASGLTLLGLASIFIVFLSFYLARGLTQPLKSFRQGVQVIGKGNLDHRIEIKTGDEIQELADEFNEMAYRLKAFRTELEESRSILEVKVRARTKELEELNKSLDEKVNQRTEEMQRSKEDLEEKLVELEKFRKLTVGRELKMVELKKEIKDLQKELEKIKKAPIQ